MKVRVTYLRLSLAVLLMASVVSSCRKSDETTNNEFFVSKELKASYNSDYIKGLVDILSISVPEAAALKQYIAIDVEVYKIVYRTTIDGHEVIASGLMSVPMSPGEYPVLSFQNGTNTVYEDAPSESARDPQFQMIEVLASMGYIVLIADYPGFGESTQIPHPYLVKEPTVRSLVDLLHAARETSGTEFPGITIKNEHYLLGYSQGGWSTLALSRALELEDTGLDLAGTACGAGPYDILELFEATVSQPTYPMPVYFAYIVDSYIKYDQFSNPVTDIFNEPYASRISTLFNGTMTSGEINAQLTTSIPELLRSDFISGYMTLPKFSGVVEAIKNNSITAWHAEHPILLTHGANDTYVDPISTESIYSGMIAAGTSTSLISKMIVPGVDHSSGVIPCMISSVIFLNNLKNAGK